MVTKPSLRSLYLYAVCLITLVMLLIGGVQTVRSIVKLAYPGVEYYDPYMYGHGPDGERLSEEEQEEVRERQEEAERRRAVLDLAGALSLLAVAAPTYFYHWRRVQREHEAAPRSAPGQLVAPERSPRESPPET